MSLAALTAGFVRFGDIRDANTPALIVALVLPYLFACSALKGYDLNLIRSGSAAAKPAFLALLVAIGCAASAGFAFHAANEFSRIESALTLLLITVYIGISRLVGSRLLRHFDQSICPRVIILTDMASINSVNSPDPVIHLPVPDLTNIRSLDKLFNAVSPVDRVILSVQGGAEREHWVRIMQCLNIDAEIVDPTLRRIVPLGVGSWQDTPTLVISRGPLVLRERAVKRAFDLTLVVLTMPIAIPVIAALMLLVKMDSPGPALFIQERLGRGNRLYRCYKLRTMRHELADRVGSQSVARHDRRVTRVGAFLRKASLDELPQLINVLKGEMSLVGPRPHALGSKADGALFWEVTPRYWTRHSMQPGITGLAQVRGLRGATETKDDLERRVNSDIEYVNSWSIWLDIRILARTVLVLRHRNAF